MSHSATLPAPLSLPSGGGLFALIELALSFLDRERLTAEERTFVEGFRAVSEKYGTYLLEAEDREELQARVDAVLEDPQFYEDCQRVSAPLDLAQLSQRLQDTADQDIAAPPMARVLGPAAIPALRRVDSYLMELSRLVSTFFKGATPATEMPASLMTAEEPLAFLSDPRVPVPLARALLSSWRFTALMLAIGAARFNQLSLERWLGLAIAELLAEQTPGPLAVLAAATGTEVPVSLLPPEQRLDFQALQQSTESVLKAYARFNAAAERSGEPVFPSAS